MHTVGQSQIGKWLDFMGKGTAVRHCKAAACAVVESAVQKWTNRALAV
jgi:hypothetical protein